MWTNFVEVLRMYNLEYKGRQLKILMHGGPWRVFVIPTR